MNSDPSFRGIIVGCTHKAGGVPPFFGATVIRRSGVRGFTLVELLVALALSAFLAAALVLIFAAARAASQDAEALARVQENTRFASEHLLRDIRMAGFRDQLTLRFPDYVRIGDGFASIDDQGRLIISYAGRNHCAQSRGDFQVNGQYKELRVVENRYSVQSGELICEGRSGLHVVDQDGSPPQWQWDGNDSSWERVALAEGVSGISFQFIGPNGQVDSSIDQCAYETMTQLEETGCLGVVLTLQMAGLRGQSPQTADLTVAFRNIVVDRIYGR